MNTCACGELLKADESVPCGICVAMAADTADGMRDFLLERAGQLFAAHHDKEAQKLRALADQIWREIERPLTVGEDEGA